jgi:hypothetical protein
MDAFDYIRHPRPNAPRLAASSGGNDCEKSELNSRSAVFTEQGIEILPVLSCAKSTLKAGGRVHPTMKLHRGGFFRAALKQIGMSGFGRRRVRSIGYQIAARPDVLA